MLEPILNIVIYAYVFGAIAIALRILWHMTFKLDRYDWQYYKSENWLIFCLSTMLWPLTAIKTPRNLVDISGLFKRQLLGLDLDLAARKRELDQLLRNPPPCGPIIRYRQGNGRYEATYGEFLFSANAVEELLSKRLMKNPGISTNDEEAILNWVSQRDNSITTPSDIPDAWWQFQYLADDLVRQGDANVSCTICGKGISADKLVLNDDVGKPGWNFNRLACPNGHNLLVVEKVHFLMSSSR